MGPTFDCYGDTIVVTSGACAVVDSLIAERCLNLIQGGPFKGMFFENAAAWFDGNMATKYVGSYEMELQPSIAKAVERRPDTVVNVGCAEGYYAVGLGRLLPYAQIFAMDKDQKSLGHCANNAVKNGIVNLTLVRGEVGPQDLSVGDGHRLYVVDIEGYEWSVLDPERCPDLLTSDIIVECHDFMVKDEAGGASIITDELQRRFAPTHHIDRIEPAVPDMHDYPCLSGLVLGTALLAVTEKRPLPTSWLACWAKSKGELNG